MSRRFMQMTFSTEAEESLNHLYMHNSKYTYPFVTIENWNFFGWEYRPRFNLMTIAYAKYKEMLPRNVVKMDKTGLVSTVFRDEVDPKLLRSRKTSPDKDYYFRKGEQHNFWYEMSYFTHWYKRSINQRKLMDIGLLYDNFWWWNVWLTFQGAALAYFQPNTKKLIPWFNYYIGKGHYNTLDWNCMHYWKYSSRSPYYPHQEFNQRFPFWRNPYHVYGIKYTLGDFKYTFKEGLSVAHVCVVGLCLRFIKS